MRCKNCNFKITKVNDKWRDNYDYLPYACSFIGTVSRGHEPNRELNIKQLIAKIK